MTVPPGWYADVALNTSWTRHTRRILSQAAFHALSLLLATRSRLAPERAEEEASTPYSFTALLFSPEMSGTQRSSRAKRALEASGM